MVTGFVVSGGTLPGNVVDAYMKARETLLGYPQRPPQLRVPSSTLSGQPAINLRDAVAGMVETQQEADALRDALQQQFPQYTWTVQPKSYPDATEVDWGR